MPKSTKQPWRETQPTRAIRLSDTLWEAIGKAAKREKTTKAHWIRSALEKALPLILVFLAISCGRDETLPGAEDLGSSQALWMPAAGGIESDIPDDLLPVGKALDVTNMQVGQTGKLVKRFGHTGLSTSIQPGGAPLPVPWQLAKYGTSFVSVAARTTASSPYPIESYSPSTGGWTGITSDRRSPVVTSLSSVPSQGGDNPRFAVGGGYKFVVYKDPSLSSVHFDMFDSTTNALLLAQSFSVGTLRIHDVVFCNGFAVMVTSEQGIGITFRRLTPATGAITTTTFATTPGAKGDVMVKDATTISVAYNDNGTNNAFAVDYVPSTLATTAWAPRDATAAAILCDLNLAWMDDLSSSGKQALITAGSVQGVRVQWDIPAAGATRQATTTYNADPAITTNVFQVEGHTITASATGEFQVVFTVTASPITNNTTRMAIRQGGVLTAGFVLYRSITLLSRAFSMGGEFYALFSWPSSTDGNSYLMRLPLVTSQPTLAPPLSIFGVGSTGNTDVTGGMNRGLTRVTGTGPCLSAIGVLNRLNRQASSNLSVNSLELKFLTISPISSIATDYLLTGPPVEAMGSLFVPGGSASQFDGGQYGELNFAAAPTQPTLTTGAAGSMTSSTTYWYVVVWARYDAQGRLWRSAPSVPVSVVMGPADTSVTVAVPTLRVTSYSNVFGEVYRGAALDDEEFQKVGQVSNSLTVDSVNFVDTNSDTALAIGEPLYTNGGILPNTTIPGSPFLFSFQNRLWFISADDPTELWFSNKITPTNGVRFNTEWVVRIADEKGGIYGVGAMADKVVAFKQNAVYSFDGDGPDDAGNGSYNTPQIVALGVGSTQPRSIIAWKDGVFFQSTASRPGMQMVDRGLSIAKDADGNPLGSAVQKYSGETIQSAIFVPEQSQIRFYCQSGRVLVYDTIGGVWTTFLLNFEGDQTLSAVSIGGQALVASNGFSLFLEDTSGATYSDAGATYATTIAFPWIQVDGIKGFQRVKDLIGTGKTVGDHTLTASMYVDLDDVNVATSKTFSETVALTPRWNWEWIPRVQRMSAMKLVLSETGTTAGFQAEGVTAWIGTKSGLARQPTSTRGP